MTPGSPGSGRDRGSVSLLVVLVALALAGAALVAMAGSAEVLIERDRATTAADASALAGVVGGREAAEAIASRNGAVLESYASTVVGASADVVEVTVQVRVGDVRATARATNGP